MTIWAYDYGLYPLQENKDELLKLITLSTRKGIARFSVATRSDIDLRKIIKKFSDENSKEGTNKKILNSSEEKIWRRLSFLNHIKKGDWIIQVNLPKKNIAICAKIIEPYYYDKKKN